MKLDQDDVDRICRLVVDHDLDTQYVADRYDISRRRVQQLAKEYRETNELPTIETPGRKPYAEYPADLRLTGSKREAFATAKNIAKRYVRHGHTSRGGRAPRQCALKSGTVTGNGTHQPAD